MNVTDEYIKLRAADLSRFMLEHCGDTTVDLRLGDDVVVRYIGVKIRPHELILRFVNEEGKKVSETIEIEYSRCYFGGRRVWFICPNCRARRTILYYAGYFWCRRCIGLSYPSWHESKDDRLFRRLLKLRKRLGGSGAIYDPVPPKPGWMRWDHYLKLYDEYMRGIRQFHKSSMAELDQMMKPGKRRVKKFAGPPKCGAQSSSKVPPKPNESPLTPEEKELVRWMDLFPPDSGKTPQVAATATPSSQK
jgi:hypothetical protein